jgi:hypothetical protein
VKIESGVGRRGFGAKEVSLWGRGRGACVSGGMLGKAAEKAVSGSGGGVFL